MRTVAAADMNSVMGPRYGAYAGMSFPKRPARLQQRAQYHLEVYGVNVKVRPEGFAFVLNYGFDGSSWTHELAATPNMREGQGDTFRRNRYGRNSEPFINTLDRAITALKGLTHATTGR